MFLLAGNVIFETDKAEAVTAFVSPVDKIEQDLKDSAKKPVTSKPTLATDIIDDIKSKVPDNPTVSSKVGKVKLETKAVPKGAYYFSDKNTLSNRGGSKKGSLFGDIQKSKQKAIIKEFKESSKANYDDTSVLGDLDLKDDGSLWGTKLKELKENDEKMTMYLRQGDSTYKIYIPPATTEENMKVIANTIESVKTYKETVKEAVLAGSIQASSNVYTMYSEEPIPLSEVMKEQLNDKGERKSTKTVNANNSSLKYTLSAFYNPLFGNMTDVKVGKKYFDGIVGNVKLTPSSDGKVTYKLAKEFEKFMEKDSPLRETLTEAKDGALKNAEGVGSWKTSVSGTKVTPDDLVDGALQVVVPKQFTKKASANVYTMEKEKSYKLIKDTKLLVSHNKVYSTGGEKIEELGDFSKFGINDKDLVLYHYNDGDLKVGAVIPLAYQEGVINTEDDNLYLTGRTLRFANDYSGKISFNDANRDILSVNTKTRGSAGIAVRNFGFSTKAKYKDSGAHEAMDGLPEKFKVEIDFREVETGDMSSGDLEKFPKKYFVMVRNNAFIEDTDLLKWLESDEAKALKNVQAQELYDLITGKFDIGNKELTYKDWLRLQEIKKELDTDLDSKLMSIIRVICIFFGLSLIIYSILLVIFYWIDVLNTFMELSILNIVTFKRLYPISNNYEHEYLSHSNGYKYVTFWHMLVLMIVGIIVGLVFIFHSPVINFLLFLYYKISSLIGGI